MWELQILTVCGDGGPFHRLLRDVNLRRFVIKCMFLQSTGGCSALSIKNLARTDSYQHYDERKRVALGYIPDASWLSCGSDYGLDMFASAETITCTRVMIRLASNHRSSTFVLRLACKLSMASGMRHTTCSTGLMAVVLAAVFYVNHRF